MVSTREYLGLVRELVTTDASETTVNDRLDEYFARHFSFCSLPITLPADAASKKRGQLCDRPE